MNSAIGHFVARVARSLARTRARWSGALSPAGRWIVLIIFAVSSLAHATDFKLVGQGNWNNDVIWQDGAGKNGVPKMAKDTATIDRVTAVGYELKLDIDPTLDAFTFDSKLGFFRIEGRKMTVNGAGAKANFVQGRVHLEESTWDGTATLTNSIPLPVGTFSIAGNSKILSPFVQDGGMDITGRVIGQNAHDANLEVADSFMNTAKARLRLNSIQGPGAASLTIKGGAGTLTNLGTIEVERTTGGARSMEGTLINQGTITIGTMFTVSGDNTAAHANSGKITLNKSTLKVIGDTMSNAGGRIEGTGKFDRLNVKFDGKGFVAPGLSAGLLSWDGDFNQAPDGVLEIEIGGPVVDIDYDQLAVTGNTLLSGILDVSLINGWTPPTTDVYTILTSEDGLSGFFGNAPSFVDTGAGRFQVSYLGTPTGPSAVTLSNFVPIPEPASLLLLCCGVLAACGGQRFLKYPRQESNL